MTIDFTLDALFFAVFIFVLRVMNYAIGTLRLVAIARGRKLLSAVLAFIEALVFAVVIAGVVSDLSNIVNLMAYCLGAAVGSYVGMVLDARMITSYMTLNIVSQKNGHDVALKLRALGHGVTETRGEGYAGEVTMLRSVIEKKDVPATLQNVREIDPNAFISIEEARAIHKGWLRQAAHMPHRNV